MDKIWFVSGQDKDWDRNKDERVSIWDFAWNDQLGAGVIRLRGENGSR